MARLEIKVGQRWKTRGGDVVRVLDVAENDHGYCFSVTVRGTSEPYSVNLNGQHSDDKASDADLISLAPATVKREVALFRTRLGLVFAGDFALGHEDARQVSAPLKIEFTLLPGETA